MVKKTQTNFKKQLNQFRAENLVLNNSYIDFLFHIFEIKRSYQATMFVIK